jgi:hypothetical protein
MRSQTPACCHSRKRLQHVIPEPQPISCGNISQGIPLAKDEQNAYEIPIVSAIYGAEAGITGAAALCLNPHA